MVAECQGRVEVDYAQEESSDTFYALLGRSNGRIPCIGLGADNWSIRLTALVLVF